MLPSRDSRFNNFYEDIIQHTVNNYDWEDNWWYKDSRLNLSGCDDDEFKKFLCAAIQWFIKPKSIDVYELHNFINRL